MSSLEEIRDLLRNGDLGLRIVKNLGSSTVALFGVFHSDGKDRLELAGTGTLVAVEGKHGILTAAHVWEEVLNKAAKLGISRIEEIDHKYLMDVKAIVPTVLRSTASEWNENGPDLAFLRIPAAFVGEIQATQVFEDVKAPPRILGVKSLECWFAMGAPKELGTFTQIHASIAIRGDMVDPKYLSGDPDYYEFEMDISSPGDPKSFGGSSGGGLWRVLVYPSPTTGKPDWARRLKGVMFWQFPEDNGRRLIRSHGPNSILAITNTVTR